MNPLMEELACNAAHFAVDNWGQYLGKGEQLGMWKRYYDSVLAALMTYEETRAAVATRASAASTLNLRVGDPRDFRDTPSHKEVSHEQEVYRPAVG